MTLEEALLKGIKIWEWLAENPTKLKLDAYAELGLVEDTNFCPMCEYALQLRVGVESMCNHCPVWTNKVRCTSSRQPFSEWAMFPLIYKMSEETVSIRAEAARKIANQIREKLNDAKRSPT